jgi:hypothetical protein
MLGIAGRFVLAWTRLYTWHMDTTLRDMRRAEIVSDMWEFQNDARGRGDREGQIAAHMLARLVGGVVADALWRLEHGNGCGTRTSWFKWVTATGVILLTATWIFASGYGATLPQFPPTPLEPLVSPVLTPRLLPPPPPPAPGHSAARKAGRR